MFNRIAMAAVLVGLVASGVIFSAQAQQPANLGRDPANPSGWTFNVSPYLWMPSINANLSYTLPPALGGTVSASPSIGFGDLVSHLNLATMFTADARYDRFSVLTDFMYLNVGGVAGKFKSVNFPNHPAIPISAAINTSASLKQNTEIWTLAGGYTVAQGDWGNFDAFAGFRLFAVNATTNYRLGVTIVGPRGNGATFGGEGSVSGSAEIWNGIGGFRGSVRLGNNGFFIPYYFDIGAGGSNLTWQIASGVGYKLSWADLALTYRYLSFQQGNSSLVQHLWINGPLLALNLQF